MPENDMTEEMLEVTEEMLEELSNGKGNDEE